MVNHQTIDLYDAFAADYDDEFETQSLRSVYDLLAWEHVKPQLPTGSCSILDVGCGTGRWTERCLDLGHSLVCLEPSSSMQDILRRKFSDRKCRLVPSSIEDAFLDDRSIDVALAMGSLQYAEAPDRAVAKIMNWLRPGGLICLHVDGLVALTLELLRMGRKEEALTRLDARHGVFTYGEHKAPLHLFDGNSVRSLLVDAGFENVETRGLLVTPSAWGKDRSNEELRRDQEGYVALERRLSCSPVLTDVGKHIFASGRRPR